MRWFAPLFFTSLAWAQSSADFTEIDRILAEASQRLSTGISIVLTQNGQVILERSYGGHNAQTPDAIASASKWMSAAVLMSVIDEGRLSFDTTFGSQLAGVPADKAGITLRQAFSHTAGFPSDTALSLSTLLAACLLDRNTTLDACSQNLLRVPLTSAPGAVFTYGSMSMQIAGRLLEVASGRRYTDLFNERLVRPLGLTGTVAGYPTQTQNPLLAGGYGSTPGDYTRFLQMLLQRGVWNGRRVLTPASVMAMHQDQTGGARLVGTFLPGLRYGVGNWLERVESGSVREVASQGAFGFSPWIDFDRNLTGVVALRNELANWQPYYLRLKLAIARAVPVARLTARGVTNAASFASGALSPSQLVTLFGASLGPAALATAAFDAQGRLPTELAGTRVWIDGVAAPLIHVSAGQVSAIVPASVAGKAGVTVEVETPGARTSAVVMPVEPAFPGLFPVAQNQDYSLNGAANPAAPGSIVILYGTGGGTGAPTMTIGGQAGEVLYGGQAPSLVEGVFQINARLPAGLAPGRHAIEAAWGGARTQPGVFVFVR